MPATANKKRRAPNSLSSKINKKSTQMDTNISDSSEDESAIESSTITVQFTSEAEDSNESLPPITGFPINTTKNILQKNLSKLLNQDENEIPYSFFIEDKEITKDIGELLDEEFSAEKTLVIKYQAQAVFKVRAVNRCTSSLPGHAEAVLCASFSPDGRFLASGSGDKTVRFWDVTTETPHFTARGHQHWVLVTAWSPDGKRLASACKKGKVRIWNPSTGEQMGRELSNHSSWINYLCWQPSHLCEKGISCKVASGSKDGTIKIWNVNNGTCTVAISGHTASVVSLRWSGEGGQEGEGYLYSASQDKTIRIWNAANGVCCRTLQGHGHWVVTLALNTDYVLRTGGNEPKDLMRNRPEYVEDGERRERAAVRYNSCLKNAGGVERMVSGSDDFTLILWTPQTSNKSIARMTGHVQTVSDVKFSPDSRLIISASFDKSIRLWNGITGQFLSKYLGHVQGVYQLAWSADSRLFVSGSKDSTLKVWSITSKKPVKDLPGHADEVYAVDWSPDGERVVSGGKDKILKIWRK